MEAVPGYPTEAVSMWDWEPWGRLTVTSEFEQLLRLVGLEISFRGLGQGA